MKKKEVSKLISNCAKNGNYKNAGVLANESKQKKDSQDNEKKRIESYQRSPILMLNVDAFYLFGNVPSLKNSKEMIFNRKTKRYMIVPSKLCRLYMKHVKPQIQAIKPYFMPIINEYVAKYGYPLYFRFKFVRDSNREFDYINACQVLADLMSGVFYPDDSNVYFLPSFESSILDKNNAGVMIQIIPPIKEEMILPNFV